MPVLQLTVYEQAELAVLFFFSFKPNLGFKLCKVFLLVIVGISLALALVVSSLSTGTIGHLVTVTMELSEQL